MLKVYTQEFLREKYKITSDTIPSFINKDHGPVSAHDLINAETGLKDTIGFLLIHCRPEVKNLLNLSISALQLAHKFGAYSRMPKNTVETIIRMLKRGCMPAGSKGVSMRDGNYLLSGASVNCIECDIDGASRGVLTCVISSCMVDTPLKIAQLDIVAAHYRLIDFLVESGNVMGIKFLKHNLHTFVRMHKDDYEIGQYLFKFDWIQDALKLKLP